MPSRPVLIGRGLVTHPPHASTSMHRVHYPESEPTTHPHHHTSHTSDTATKAGTREHVHNRTTVHNVTAAIAAGKHPDPSRTRKLSQPAPMVLHPTGCGRVGRRRTSFCRWGPSSDGPHRYRGARSAPASSRSRGVRERGRRSSSVERGSVPWAFPGWAIRASRAAAASDKPVRQAPLRQAPLRRWPRTLRLPRRSEPRLVGAPPARATGRGRPRSRGRAPSTRSGTTVRRCPRTSPAVSSTARSARS